MTKTKIEYKLLDPYHRTMIELRKELDSGKIKPEEFQKRFDEVLRLEMAKEITKIREESKQDYYRAIIAGASFGILGSFLANALFSFLLYPSGITSYFLLICAIAFFSILIFVVHELDKITKRELNKSWIYKLRHRYRRFQLKIKK